VSGVRSLPQHHDTGAVTMLASMDLADAAYAQKMLEVFGKIMRDDASRGGVPATEPRNPCCGVAHMSFDRPPWCQPGGR